MKDKIEKSPICKGKKVYYVPFGIDQTIFKPAEDKAKLREELKISEKQTVIMFRSDAGSFKGFDIIKKTLNLLKDKKNITFLTVGEIGLLSEYDEYFDIRDYGWIKNDKELVKLYQASDIFLMPSRCETFGMMAIEAMSCGIAVASLKCDGTPLETITNAPTCGINETEENYPKVIKKLLSSSKELKERGQKCFDYAIKHYSKDKYIENIIKVYKEIIANHEIVIVTSARTDGDAKLVLEQLKLHMPEEPIFGGEELHYEDTTSKLRRYYRRYVPLETRKEIKEKVIKIKKKIKR